MSIKKVFIAHSWSDVGVNIQTKAVAKRLSESTKVLFISQSRIFQEELKVNDKLRVVEWPHKRPNTFKDLLFICKKIVQEKPDVFIAHFGATNISMIAAWLLRVKYRICWIHTLTAQYYSDIKDERIAKKVIRSRRRIYSLATNIVVLNEYGLRDAVDNYLIPRHKIAKIFNGINNDAAFSKSDHSCKSFRYAGRIDNSKGVDILIKAFSKLRKENNNIVLEIAGKGSDEENLKLLSRSEHCEAGIKFHGFFDRYETAMEFIGEAYCLIVPSRADNFPTVILEAFSAGVPVIATYVGGITDMLEDGKEGYLVEGENVEALAIAIKKMIEDTSLRNRMAQQARMTFEEKFSMEKHVNNVVAFLDNLN